MWGFSTLDLFVAGVMLLALGFGLGTAYWAYRERADARSSDNVLDLSVSVGTGSVRGDVGPGGVRDSDSSSGDEDHMDHSGTGRTTAVG